MRFKYRMGDDVTVIGTTKRGNVIDRIIGKYGHPLYKLENAYGTYMEWEIRKSDTKPKPIEPRRAVE